MNKMKSIKKVSSVLLLSGVVLGLGANASQAAEVATANSKATVEFEKNSVPLGFEGAKATDISFGKVIISGNTETYDAVYTDSKFTPYSEDSTAREEYYAAPYVSVRDDRGTMPGYKVTVKMTKQLTDAKNGNTLKGATIELETTNVDTDKVLGERVKPTHMSKVVVGESDFAATSPTGPHTVFGAQKGEGAGTWNFFFGANVKSATKPDNTVKNDKVKLTVPGGNSIVDGSSYEGELLWSLDDTPEKKAP